MYYTRTSKDLQVLAVVLDIVLNTNVDTPKVDEVDLDDEPGILLLR